MKSIIWMFYTVLILALFTTITAGISQEATTPQRSSFIDKLPKHIKRCTPPKKLVAYTTRGGKIKQRCVLP